MSKQYNIKRTKIINDENREIYKAKNITENDLVNISNTIITQPKLNKDKRLTAAFIDTNKKSTFFIETPYLKLPFGASAYEQKDVKTWSITAKAQGEKTDEIKVLFDYLYAVQDKALDLCAENSKLIFKKELTKEQILTADKFKGCIKKSANQEGVAYPDSITFKIAKNENNVPLLDLFKISNNVPTKVEISSMEELPSLIPKGSDASFLFKLNIYFVNGNAGINLKLYHILVPETMRYTSPTGVFVFSEDLIGGNTNVPPVVVSNNETVTPSATVATIENPVVVEKSTTEESVEVEDSEEEEEDEEDDEEEVA